MDNFMDVVMENIALKGRFGVQAFVVYFLNDQVKRLHFELMEEYKDTPFYKHRSKQLLNQIGHEIQVVMNSLNRTASNRSYEVADRLILLEEAYLPVIDTVLDNAKLFFAEKGFSPAEQEFLRKVYGLFLLSRTSSTMLSRIQNLDGLAVPRLVVMKGDSLTKAYQYCSQLLDHWMGHKQLEELKVGTEALNQSICTLSRKLLDFEVMCELLTKEIDC